MNKHTKLRIESWCKKLCQLINNVDWKKNRNLHAICLLDMIINNHYEEPYNKFAPDGSLPKLSKPLIKSKISSKFVNYSQQVFNLPLSKRNQDHNIKGNMNSPFKMKRPMTPGEKSLNNYNYMNKRNNIELINKCNDPDLLKRFIKKTQKKINETEEIINRQKEEKQILLKNIKQIELLIKSYNNN